MMYSVDRIEEEIAVCVDENGGEIRIKNDGFSEGDIIEKIGENFVVNKNETEKIRNMIFDLQESLFDE